MPTISILNGACWVFEFAGAGMITAVGTLFTYVVMKFVPWFNDPTSIHFVAEPVVLLVFVGALCLVISLCFMITFDTVADSLLYCLAVEGKRRARGQLDPSDRYAPDHLYHAYKHAHTHA